MQYSSLLPKIYSAFPQCNAMCYTLTMSPWLTLSLSSCSLQAIITWRSHHCCCSVIIPDTTVWCLNVGKGVVKSNTIKWELFSVNFIWGIHTKMQTFLSNFLPNFSHILSIQVILPHSKKAIDPLHKSRMHKSNTSNSPWWQTAK